MVITDVGSRESAAAPPPTREVPSAINISIDALVLIEAMRFSARCSIAIFDKASSLMIRIGFVGCPSIKDRGVACSGACVNVPQQRAREIGCWGHDSIDSGFPRRMPY